jgi:hypothetical protein
MKKLITLFSIVLFNFQINAQTSTVQTGPAYGFLLIGTDARHGGTGDAGVASPSDATDFFYNPSKSAFAETKFGVFLSPHNPWLTNIANDVNFRRFGAFYKLNDKNAFSANFTHFNEGATVLTDANGQLIGAFKSYEWTLGVNYSRKLLPKLSMGVGLKYIKSSFYNGLPTFLGFVTPAPSSIAADISLYHHNTDESKVFRIDYGVYLSNIGGKVNYAGLANLPMPTNLRFGTGTLIRWAAKHKTIGLVDVNKLLLPSEGIIDYYKGFSYSIGVEYWYDNIFAVRFGSTTNTKIDYENRFLTTGLGIKLIKNIELDLAYLFDRSQSKLVGNLWRANVSIGFDKIKTQNEKK